MEVSIQPQATCCFTARKESFCEVGTEFLNVVYKNFSYNIQFVITEG